jgi:hypothetical protein
MCTAPKCARFVKGRFAGAAALQLIAGSTQSVTATLLRTSYTATCLRWYRHDAHAMCLHFTMKVLELA